MSFLTVNLLGSVLFLGAVTALYHVTGSLAMAQIAERTASLQPGVAVLIATILLVAFGIKLGFFPFHSWVPAVYRDTRPAVAALLAGALANIGSYGLLRFGVEMLPTALSAGAPVLLLLGGASILYGEIVAFNRFPSSEVLAYSAIGQAGYVVVALAIGGLAGYAAAVLYAVANSLNKAALFLTVGIQGPWVGAAFAVGAFSVAGVPPSVGFLAKLLVFQAAVASGRFPTTALLLLGGALSFLYMFQVYQRLYWSRGESAVSSPLSARLLALAIASLLVALGAWPEPLLALVRQSAATLMGLQG